MQRTMARKRKGVGGRPKGPDPQRRVIASFKASQAFEGWLDRLMEHCRASSGWADLPVSAVIEKSLVLYAKSEGFDEDAPKR